MTDAGASLAAAAYPRTNQSTVLAVAMVPTVWVGRVWSTRFWLSDVVAAIVMVWFSLWLGVQGWRGLEWRGRRFWAVRVWPWLFGARVAEG